MGRRKVPHREVAPLLDELTQSGARRIRRGPIGLDGRVEVRWQDSDVDTQRYHDDLHAYRPVYVLSAIMAVLILAAMVILGR